MTADIIDIEQPIQTFCIETTDIPKGIPGAFHDLESRVGNLKGKKFYGVVLCEAGSLFYRACVQKEPGMQLPGTMDYVIPAGRYARTIMLDWQSKIPMIKDNFIEMEKLHVPDHSRPQIEYYKSDYELILLQPIV